MRAVKEKILMEQQDDLIFALDIGTRSIIGIAGRVEDERLRVDSIEIQAHSKRAMIDGQIEDIEQVSKVVQSVKERMEKKLQCRLTRVCVAAAGRALKTQKATFELELPKARKIDAELISRLEAGAVEAAEKKFALENDDISDRLFYLSGYTVVQYLLDNYPISSLKGHQGKKLYAEIIATFLPSEVLESLYAAMDMSSLEVASLTLEPIAAINAVIPQNLRLLNLALVDIGAGTSDIALSRDGSVVGYTMATVAGDEVTETLMKNYLVDFNTAEQIKFGVAGKKKIQFLDILGIEHSITKEEVFACIDISVDELCKEIAEKIIDLNGAPPSAVFLAGGGSKLPGVRERIAEFLNMDEKRVAVAGNNFQISAFSNEFDIENPEFATPLGIAVSAGLNLINDSCHITLNGHRAKLFSSNALTVQDLLMMNGYNYTDIIGRSGRNLIVTLNGERMAFYGEPAKPAVLKKNGMETKITEYVYAGDTIDFQPAVSGISAEKTLGELLDGWSENLATVNGIELPLDTPLVSGDVILTLGEELIPDWQEPPLNLSLDEKFSFSKVYETAVEKVPEVITPVVAPVAVAPPVVAPPVVAPPVVAPPVVAKDLAASRVLETAKPPSAPSAPGPAPAATPPKETKLSFILNGLPLELPLKPDKDPYYLMDMLEYSGINFKNVAGSVSIEVNGEIAPFQQVLKPGDQIQISETGI